jgi:hypothetical protein
MSQKLINAMADHVCKNAKETVEYCKKYMGV